MTSQLTCATCGAQLAADARFCNSCACPVEHVVSETDDQSEALAQETQEEALAQETPEEALAQGTPEEARAAKTDVTVKEYTPHFVPKPSVSEPTPPMPFEKNTSLVTACDRSDLSVPNKCSVCGHSVSVNHEVYCSECGCRAHMACWKENDGCGEEYCHSDTAHLLMATSNMAVPDLLSTNVLKVPSAILNGATEFMLHGNGTVELISHMNRLEKKTLMSAAMFAVTAWLFGPYSIWIYLVTAIGASLSLSGFLAAWYKMRKHTTIQAPSNSISSQLMYFGKRISDKDGFRFKEDIVEVHLQFGNVTVESMEEFQRKLSRDPKASVPSVRFECSLLTIEDEYIPLFTQKSRFLNDVLNVAEEIATALDVPLRKMGMGPPLTRQERKRLIGRHVGDGIC